MNRIDRVVFGDNQFFGINHMSQEKAQLLAEQFRDLDSIFEVYEMAYGAGIRGIMLNSNERAAHICERFRAQESRFAELSWYPSIPYPHKYANLIAEMGLVPALHSVLTRNNSALKMLGVIAQGGVAILSKDAIQLMRMLVDIEMKIFMGFNFKAVFLQNVVTDLILGLRLKVFFEAYCDHIRDEYHATPGFITQNLPDLLQKLKEWKISGVVVCSSVNKIGYLMSPNVAAYESALAANISSDYQIMAMSTLASGAIPAREAYGFLGGLNIQSVVFGASSRRHIDETVSLIGANIRAG